MMLRATIHNEVISTTDISHINITQSFNKKDTRKYRKKKLIIDNFNTSFSTRDSLWKQNIDMYIENSHN